MKFDFIQNNFEKFFDNSPLPAWIIETATLKILRVNNSAVKLFEYSLDEFISKSINDIIVSDRSKDNKTNSKSIGNTASNNILKKFKTGSGKIIHTRVYSNTINIEDKEYEIQEIVSLSNHEWNSENDAYKFSLNEELLNFHSNILKNVRDSIIVTDKEGKIIYWNRGAESIFGYTEKEMLGKTNSILYPDLNEKSFQADLEKILKGEDYIGEWKGMHKSGKEVWIDIKSSLMYDKNHHPIGFVGVAKDITKQKITENLYNESEDEKNYLINNLPLVLFSFDRDGIITLSSGSGLKSTGLKEGEIVGKSAYDVFENVFVKEDNGRVTHAVEILNRVYNGEAISGQTDFGGVIFYNRFIPKKDQQQNIIGFIGVSLDITEKKQIEQNLEEVSWHLQAIFRYSPVGITVFDSGAKIKMWNPANEKIFGWKQSEVINKSVPYLHPENENQFKYIYNSALEGKIFVNEEAVRYRKDGKRIIVNVSTSAFKDWRGNIIGVVAFLNDITKKKAAEDKLRESRRQLRALAAKLQSIREEERTSIAREIHDELGQTMTALKMDVSMLLKKFNKFIPESKLDEIRNDVNSTKNLIDHSIKTIRKITHELRYHMLDELGLVDAMEKYINDISAKSGIKIKFITDLDDFSLDRVKSTNLFRILQEAVTNILRHSKATRTSVELKKENNMIRLIVSDNGKGISKANKEKKGAFGIIGMKERAIIIGGSIKIQNNSGGGTKLEINVPYRY